jgi:hypothetical protein
LNMKWEKTKMKPASTSQFQMNEKRTFRNLCQAFLRDVEIKSLCRCALSAKGINLVVLMDSGVFCWKLLNWNRHLLATSIFKPEWIQLCYAENLTIGTVLFLQRQFWNHTQNQNVKKEKRNSNSGNRHWQRLQSKDLFTECKTKNCKFSMGWNPPSTRTAWLISSPFWNYSCPPPSPSSSSFSPP